MTINPLIELEKLGQSIWLDYIKRDLISSGKLTKLIAEDGLSGMTSNPNLFEKAIAESTLYANDIKELANQPVEKVYEALTIKDVQDVADIFRAQYDERQGQDGYVSLEVNPHLAHDATASIEEARHLWRTLNRPNVFIKIPATKEGLIAIKQLTSEGINVNVTLLFGLPRYREVAEAYISGIEMRLAQNKSIDQLYSVASFFLSRIDVLLDPILQQKNTPLAQSLIGEIAIAQAKVAYQIYEEIFNSARFKKLKEANKQRLLWASTSTKNPQYSDVKYVESLIAPYTINTLPMETLEAYKDHGNPKVRINEGSKEARNALHSLTELGINMDEVTQQLEDEGVEKFNKAYDMLIKTLKTKMADSALERS